MDAEAIVVVSETENEVETVEELMNEEEIASEEENVVEEEEKNEENAIVVAEDVDHATEQKNEENAMEVEKNGENATEVVKNGENATEDQKKGENAMEVEKNGEKLEAGSVEKVKKPRKRNRRKKVTKVGSDAVTGKTEDKMENSGKKEDLKKMDSEALVAKEKDKPESSGKKKALKKKESMGMIFMCSSKTKKDCFRYKVLGLPAGKKDVVQKIYKGMRLFLFDFDLRLMYGIFKAAGPGGYNIEPKAFKSAFPSQVRFTIMEDCSPLTEDTFRNVMKENYYTRNKFDCQLNPIQVKNLCKLFNAAGKGGSKPKKVERSLRTETHTSAPAPPRKSRRRTMDEERRSTRGKDRDRRNQKRRSPIRRDRSPVRRDPRYHEHLPVMYERKAFASPVASRSLIPALPQPAALAPIYNYERTSEMDAYQREALYEHRERRLLDMERRRRDEIELRDPYVSYREPPREVELRDPYVSYREQPLYRDPPLYSTGLQLEYRREVVPEYRSAVPAEYHSGAATVGPEYRRLPSAALQQAEYRSAATLQPLEYSQAPPLYRY